MSLADAKRKARKSLLLLERSCGRPCATGVRNALDRFVFSFLIIEGLQEQASKAFEVLYEEFCDWNELRVESPEVVREVLRNGGVPEINPSLLLRALKALFAKENELSLDHLRRLSMIKLRQYFEEVEPLGTRREAVTTLLLLFEHAVIPPAPDVIRVAERLGLMADEMAPEEAEAHLTKIVAKKASYRFYVAFKDHGGRTCTARTPNCRACPARNVCDWYEKYRAKSRPAAKKTAAKKSVAKKKATGKVAGKKTAASARRKK